VNAVTVIGNLATDVELKDVGQDRQVATFVLALARPTSDGEADFIRVAAWNRQAELCEQYLAKGSRVGIEGRLRSRSWEEPDGKRRSAVEVVASSVQFLSEPREASGVAPAEAVA
jgi:single-strand DNA-binding protein